MFLADSRITTNGSGTFRLYLIGDLHADRKAFQAERFKRWRTAIVNWIERTYHRRARQDEPTRRFWRVGLLAQPVGLSSFRAA